MGSHSHFSNLKLAHIAPAEEPIALVAFASRAVSNPRRKWMRFTHSVIHLTNLLYHILVFTMAVSGTAAMGSKPKLIVFDLGKNLGPGNSVMLRC